jgi:hypothetical protein
VLEVTTEVTGPARRRRASTRLPLLSPAAALERGVEISNNVFQVGSMVGSRS